MSRSGKSTLRGLGVSNYGNNITGDLDKVRKFGQTPTLQRAVVIDVVIDPNLLSNNQIELIKTSVNNPEFAEIMPVNAIIARMVSDNQGNVARNNTILFPLFSSHFMLPVQPGEMVEVVYDDYSDGGNAVGFWVTRTSSERTIEDLNYTHFDRRFDLTMNPANFSTSERNDRSTVQPLPGFPNGGNTPQTLTLAVSSSGDKPYERIIKNASAYYNSKNAIEGIETDGSIPLTTPEAVPRWRKRPQEFVIQGANNTLICLGEDRKGGPFGALISEKNQSKDAKSQAGTIDIVAGRGRVLPTDPTLLPDQQRGDVGKSPTSPLITENTRGNIETDKAPYRRIPGEDKLKDNIVEGDPDFIEDAARIYVSMQTEADKNFGLIDISYTDDTTPITQPREGQGGSINKSYIVNKADHLRFIARSDLSNNNSKGIDGTIAIIREGKSEDGQDSLGLIYVDKTGIQIEGSRINLGRGLANVAASGGSPTPGGEPYIRWSKYRDSIDSIHKEMDIMRQEFQTTFDNLQSTVTQLLTALQASAGASVCIPLMSDPAFTSLNGTLPGILAKLNVDVSVPRAQADPQLNNQKQNTDTAVSDSRSGKIFGE